MSRRSKRSSYLTMAAIAAVILVTIFMFAGEPRSETGEVPSEARSVTSESASRTASSSSAEGIEFNDLESQMKEFMGYYRTIELTAEQEAIKAEVLGDQPAVCCHNSSALNCCCPCNLSKSLWGLANYLIAEKGMSGEELDATLDEWIAFTNPSGYTGDACYTGGCGRSPRENGCGGMSDARVVV